MEVDEEPVQIDVELRVLTHASVWLIRPEAYMRMPRDEQRRWPPSTGALADGIWHPHRGAWRILDGDAVRYRILPAHRSDGAFGVVTGEVIASAGIRRRPNSQDVPRSNPPA